MKKILLKLLSLVVMTVLSFNILVSCQTVEEELPEQTEEQEIIPVYNPVSRRDAADPFMTYDSETGYYYALFTLSNRIEIFRSKHAATILKSRDSKIIYKANKADGIYGRIWAPEMHKGTDGKWYIYTSGKTDPNSNVNHLFVIQAQTDDPFGEWSFKGVMMPELYCVDPTVYTIDFIILKKQYLCYSRVDEEDGQVLELCEMINPYTCSDNRVTIAKAELEWELVEPYTDKNAIVEGPFFLNKDGRLFIIYSANGCWSNSYSLGVLEHLDGDIMDAANWEKHPEPLLTMGNGVYGPGHASFFESPDGSEIWCAYHGMTASNDSAAPVTRCFNIQKVDFDSTGFPIMGKPVGNKVRLIPPSGEAE